jgi:hypothetical protein
VKRSEKNNTEAKQSENKNTEAKQRTVTKQKEKYGSENKKIKIAEAKRSEKMYAKFSLKHAKRKWIESRFASLL